MKGLRMYNREDVFSYENPFLKQGFRGDKEDVIEAEFIPMKEEELVLEEVEGVDYKEVSSQLALPPSQDSKEIYSQIKKFISLLQGVGIKWIVKKTHISKKQLERYLETGKGLHQLEVERLIVTLLHRYEREVEIEEKKKERDQIVKQLTYKKGTG